MPYTQELVEELNILVRYDLTTTQAGIKVHQHSAAPEIVAATQRLFDKGLVSQADGGYLTTLGHEAAEQAQMLLGLLNPSN
ncbi:MAG: TIGR02647 family protein [Methylococcaceae bacterium]